MNYLLIILICNQISKNFVLTQVTERYYRNKDLSDIQSQRFRRDSTSVTYPFISIPGYRTGNSPTPSSSVFCPINETSYAIKSIIVSNIGLGSGATLNIQDGINSITNTAKARGSVLVFDNPPTSKCYLLNFSSSTSIDMNNLKIQFIYDSTSNVVNDGMRSFASDPGYKNFMFPSTSNQNAVCGSVTCKNGGTCQYMGTSGYQCQCGTSGQWLGNDCSKSNPCMWSPCYNGGQCYYFPDATYYCVCTSGYTGSSCQSPLSVTPSPAIANSYNPCLSLRPCLNGGTCLPQGNQGGFTCTCPQGYTGVNCQSSNYVTNPSTVPSNNCGISSLKYALPPSDYDRIVGGTPVKSNTWPWIVSIQTYSGSHFCGGTLIDAFHVITAGHCFDAAGTTPSNFKVVAGLLSMRQTYASSVQQLTIDRIYRHERYSSTALVNDITILKLRTPAQINSFVSPICLPNGNGAHDPKVGQNVLIAGWGYTNSKTKQIADQLQEATIQILDINGDLHGGPGCNAWMRRGYTLNNGQQICAMSRDTRIDSCQGDSGGPLIGAVDSKWYIFGIVSYGDAICGSSTAAGVYTRVSGYASWIQQKLQL